MIRALKRICTVIYRLCKRPNSPKVKLCYTVTHVQRGPIHIQSIKMPQSSKRLISDVQQKTLRDWTQNQPPRPTQKACIAWFYAEYNHRLSQSTASDILSSQYHYLNSKSNPSNSSRKGTGQWNDIENILYEWQHILNLRGAYISDNILVEKARKSGILHLNIAINHHPYLATDGYADSSNDLITNSVHTTVKQVRFQKKLRKK